MTGCGLRMGWLIVAATFMASATVGIAADKPARRPNVVVILTDDQGIGLGSSIAKRPYFVYESSAL